MEKLSYELMNSDEILYLSTFWKYLSKNEISLKADKNYGYFM
jgi:hypothetical protein